LEPGVKKAADEAMDKLKKSRRDELEEISMPSLPLALAVYYIICPAEVSSNLAAMTASVMALATPRQKSR
jgi:aspartyl-tRNA(Asn)/glutamyl-tRNA(Gln) amidotransferase subunit A